MTIRFKRTRKVVFWMCIAFALLVGVAWIFSTFSGLQYACRTSSVPLPANPLLSGTSYPSATLLLIDGEIIFMRSPGFLPETLKIAWTFLERYDISSTASMCVALGNSGGPPVPFWVAVVPLWIPLSISLAIATILFVLSRRAGPRAFAGTPKRASSDALSDEPSDAPSQWIRRKRATWQRTAFSIPVLIVALIVTPFLMAMLLETFFPRMDIENELRRRYGIPSPVIIGAALAIWMGLSYCVARIVFALTAWTHILIFGEGHIPCEQCGYDLKGNTSGICPECGTAVDKAGRHGEAAPAVASEK